MLTLQNFETYLSPAIVQRGQQYYRQNAVAWLEEIELNTWQAEVEGSATYQVDLTLKNKDEISAYSCDCPYDGSTCKHAVAVFFALRHEQQKPKSKQAKASAKKDGFHNLLQKISLPEYQEFIRRYATRDKDFKTEFELYFAAKDDQIDVGQKYEDLLRKLIRKHSDQGFVDYRATFGLAKEVGKLLANGEDFIRQNNFLGAFTLAGVVLKAMMEVATECDDSNGNIGETVARAIQLLESIAEAAGATRELKEQVFDFLRAELANKIYFDYGDYGYDLFAIFQHLAVELRQADTFLSFIAARLPRLTGQYDDYEKEFFQQQQIEFLIATGHPEEAEKLVQQNLAITQVRQGEVNKAIARKDFEAAKKLITDGIRIAENKNHPGTVADWQKELLRVAVLEKDVATIRHYTRYFAFDRSFDPAYYQQWKATYAAAEWPAVIENYLQKTVAETTQQGHRYQANYWHPAHPPLLQKLAPIYVQEQYWDRLLALVQKANKLETTLRYHAYLAPRYPAELLQLYLPALAQYGEQANGRPAYADLVNKMKQVIRDIPAGKEPILTLARRLKEQFPRRPAMVEELNKLLK